MQGDSMLDHIAVGITQEGRLLALWHKLSGRKQILHLHPIHHLG